MLVFNIMERVIYVDKRTTAKSITTIVCLILSAIALYTFLFVLDISTGWRVFLTILAISWIASGIFNLHSYFKK